MIIRMMIAMMIIRVVITMMMMTMMIRRIMISSYDQLYDIDDMVMISPLTYH